MDQTLEATRCSASLGQNGENHGEFTINLKPTATKQKDQDTMEWWASHPDAWRASTRNQCEPKDAMQSWVAWVESRSGRPVFAAHPLSFDGAWIDWYLQTFVGRRLFYRPRDPGLSDGAGIDIPSLLMAKLGWPYERCNRRNYPGAWLGGHKHSHYAIDDARGYSHLLGLILTDRLRVE